MQAKVGLFAGLNSSFHSPNVEPTKVLSNIGEIVGSVVKKRRKKMRKHKQRKLLKRQRHKK